MLEQLEAVIDAVIAGQRGGERHPRLEHPGLAALQVDRQDVGRVDEEVRPEIFALRIAGELAQIGLQLVLAGAPGEIGVGLGEAELASAFMTFGRVKASDRKITPGSTRLHLADQPFPERKRLGVRIVDPEDAHALRDPEQHDVAQRRPKPFGIGAVEIRVDDVLIFLRRVFGILDRAVGPALEPFGMLRRATGDRASIAPRNRAPPPCRGRRRRPPGGGNRRACRVPDGSRHGRLRPSRSHRGCPDRPGRPRGRCCGPCGWLRPIGWMGVR